MKASKENLECAETILSHHIIDNRVTSLRALTRDIALSIDLAEEAARDKEYQRVVSAIRNLRLNFVPVNTVLEAIAHKKSVHAEKSV